MSRRGSNIYKRKDGRFEGRVPVGYREDGKIKYSYVYARTLADVKEKMNAKRMNPEKNTTKQKRTVKEIADEWLADKKITVKPASYSNYKRLMDNHVFPYIGGIRFSILTKQKLNAWIAELLISGRKDKKGGISVKTAREILTIFKSICSYAHSEYGFENPAENVRLPKADKNIEEFAVLCEQERKQLEQFLLYNPDLTNMGILLCLYTGIRIGELCALQWDDVDFSRKELRITKTLQRISLGNGATKIQTGTPKSRTSIRTVPMPEFICQYLMQFKGLHTAYLLSGNGMPVEPRTMQNRFKAVLKECGIRKLKFHGLRHTYATLCIERGFDPKALSEILGHADVNITLNRYVHSSDEMKKRYVERLMPTE